MTTVNCSHSLGKIEKETLSENDRKPHSNMPFVAFVDRKKGHFHTKSSLGDLLQHPCANQSVRSSEFDAAKKDSQLKTASLHIVE